MKMNKLILVAGLAATLALTGCAGSGNASARNDQAISKIVKHKTTYNEVKELMGEPNDVSLSGEGRELSYYHVQVSPTAYIPFVALFNGMGDREGVKILIDKNDIVQDVLKTSAKL